MKISRLFLGAFILIGAAQIASAATLCVKPGGGGGCFATIQAAINAAKPGDTIKPNAATYIEQIVIEKNLTLLGRNGVIIQAPGVLVPAGPTFAIVRVANAAKVTLEKLQIQGPGPSGCGSLHFGIKVEGGANVKIIDNQIRDIRDEPFSGCQNGNGIQVGRTAEGQVGTATIQNNTIEDYQKSGIVVDGIGSSATIQNNDITGAGPTAVIAQNGIQISRGAKGVLQKNKVSDHVYSPGTVSSTGVLLFEAGAGVDIKENDIDDNDVGVYGQTAADAEITKNTISGSTFDGIDLLVNSTNNAVKSNKVSGSGLDGIYIDVGSIDNQIKQNVLSNNTEHDAHDDNPPDANDWAANKCSTQSQPGLCG